jgi:DNA invertase Pin-like site-specific DNA recombinase
MSDNSKVTAVHLRRHAFVYVRQSTTAQVEYNRESTERQYRLAERAAELGWQREQIKVLDQDLGVSGSGLAERAGFTHMTAEVALGHVGIVLGLEVSRLARNNADWYRLLDLCGTTDTLIGDADGIYHPGMFNDRLVLGLKGTMSEAELHVLRARLNGGIRNKAARGELRRGLPVGLIWGEADGEVLLHPDEAVSGAIRAVFERFAEMAPHARCGYGFVNTDCAFRCNRMPYPKCVGLPRVIRRSMEYSAIRSMRALMSMAKLVVSVMSMRPDEYANACGTCLAASGRSSFVTITAASSTGRRSRPINCGWRKTLIRVRTRLEER